VQDLLPTLMDLCDLKSPPDAKFDGTSLAGLLRGTADEAEKKRFAERMLVVQYGQEPKKGQACVMQGSWRLVHNEELYDTAADRAQEKNVAAEHPEKVAALRAHYETWWGDVEPKLYDFSPISLGAAEENPVTLTAADWANVYCDNMKNLREGLNRNSAWHVLVEQAGEYEIELRRWPREADAPIAGEVPAFQAVDGILPAGAALPIVKARLTIGEGFDESHEVAASDKGVTFTTKIAAGKTTMQSWFYDAEGKQLSGAYFAYVRRK